ncbi:MAG: HNH endonuclease [Planctomycetes bacterium]|nr:HNH endonuclease [Planctomycetota bacterium]
MRVIPGYPNYVICEDGDVWSCERGEYLKCRYSHGYIRMHFGGETHCVHRLLLTVFVRPPEPGEEGRHLNDIRTDNRLENLAWGTHEQNMADAKRNGVCLGVQGGSKNSNSKLIEKQVLEIRELYSQGGCTQVELGNRYGITQVAIWRIVHRIDWQLI